MHIHTYVHMVIKYTLFLSQAEMLAQHNCSQLGYKTGAFTLTFTFRFHTAYTGITGIYIYVYYINVRSQDQIFVMLIALVGSVTIVKGINISHKDLALNTSLNNTRKQIISLHIIIFSLKLCHKY